MPEDVMPSAKPHFVVVVPPERPEVYEQLRDEMSGEDVDVIVDRRQGERRQQSEGPKVDRRRTYRRGKSRLSMTPAAKGRPS